MENSCIVLMKCLTNMHVGNGDVNYNIIDNEVERDPVTGFPCVNASGVKGALRSYFSKNASANVVELFGSDSKDSNHLQGGVKILGAEMIAMPQRASKGNETYYLVSKTTAVERANKMAQTLIDKDIVTNGDQSVDKKEVEGKSLTEAKKVDGKDIYFAENNVEDMVLPVMARNCLENGQSKNLWYEEIVPHESIFFFGVIADNSEYLEKFCDVIDGKVVQFGADATIGYGLCELKVIR